MSDLADYLTAALGKRPRDLALYEQALTHGSASRTTYERLEFLGDRVLGLAVAEWLYARFPDEPEGKMSRRYNALVARETCAEVGRAIAVQPHIRLGRQAREDHATDSDNVIGDVVESLIGALYLDHDFAAASAFIRVNWAAWLDSQKGVRFIPSRRFGACRGQKHWAPAVRNFQPFGPTTPHLPHQGHIRGAGEAKPRLLQTDAADCGGDCLLEKVGPK